MPSDSAHRPTSLPAITFHAEGYTMSGSSIMGRQAAGASFLRAYAEHGEGETLSCYSNNPDAITDFEREVRKYTPSAQVEKIGPLDFRKLARKGALYVPDPSIGTYANARLRVGADRYSLTGITHTTASHAVMDMIAGLATDAVMPWDALICTSDSVSTMVKGILQEQIDFLSWRFGNAVRLELPKLPVIPLGIHTDDFHFTEADRQAARASLKIAEDEVAVLFVGRLAHHAKAHPHAMCAAVEEVAQQTGKKLVLVQCGWFANKTIESMFRAESASICPSVRLMYLDGTNPVQREQAWAASDIFMSLSDNIQETFGLTPIEAMAAGLPVIVSDWDGYKETVPDTVCGFRIPTAMPGKETRIGFSARYELGLDSYDRYCGYTCQYVAVDHDALLESLKRLVLDPNLRHQMGQAGRAHARSEYDWRVVFKQYMALWADQERHRNSSQHTQRWVKPHPARQDPFALFQHYPTHVLDADTTVRLRRSDAVQHYKELRKLRLFDYASQILPTDQGAELVLAAIADNPGQSLKAIGADIRVGTDVMIACISNFAKMGLVSIEK